MVFRLVQREGRGGPPPVIAHGRGGEGQLPPPNTNRLTSTSQVTRH